MLLLDRLRLPLSEARARQDRHSLCAQGLQRGRPVVYVTIHPSTYHMPYQMQELTE